MRALGIDVGVRKGLHLVALDARLRPLFTRSGASLAELHGICQKIKPDVVAIDSPPHWAIRGNSRLAERDLQSRRVHLFATPSDPEKRRSEFYDWMRVGFKVFKAVAPRFPLYRSGPVRRHAIEVFPHASAVHLAGWLKPEGYTKVRWRRSILEREGVSVDDLTNADLVDAALGALTGLYALRGDFAGFGDPKEGVVVVPRSDASGLQFESP
jgi:predicted RNase H-like nuclease